MIGFFRRGPARARLALVLLLTGWVVPSIAPHPAEDDRLCLPAWAQQAGDDERVAAATTHQPDHCTICHAARSLRAAATACGSSAAVLEPQNLSDAFADSVRLAPAYDRLPARAPPAAA